MLATPEIPSPKRTKIGGGRWDSFFSYYVGFSEYFAREMIRKSGLVAGSLVHDPWNGSGTTTYAASMEEMPSLGFDLNPVMVIVAKARLLPTSEADSIEPLGQKILSQALNNFVPAKADDPLTSWFGSGNAATLRSLEVSIRDHLVGTQTLRKIPVTFDRLSSLAAVNYVALFSVARELAGQFRTSNPTWFRYARADEKKPHYRNATIRELYLRKLREMAEALEARESSSRPEVAPANIRVADTTKERLPANTVDLVLTSPPYCTRIDYTAATRIELALLAPVGARGIRYQSPRR